MLKAVQHAKNQPRRFVHGEESIHKRAMVAPVIAQANT
jgi:hypothetical protein